MIGTRVTLTARVVSTRAPSGDRTPFNFRLGDPTPNSAGSLDMVFWNDVAQTIPAQHRAEPDQFIQVTGRIDEFRGNIQLRLMNASDIQVLPNAPNAGEQSQAEKVRPKAISLAELGTIAENTIVTVEVTIQGSEEIPFGRKLSVTTKDADQATGTVLFYDTALSPDTKLSPGNSIKVLGRRVTLEGQPAIATLSPSEKLTIGI
jgi:DNA/RNA endonuclease YhcR with UshA esterase domain